MLTFIPVLEKNYLRIFILVEMIETPHHKNNIIGLNKKDDYTSESWADTPCFFQTIFQLANVNAKKGRGEGTTLLGSYIIVIFFQPFLSVPILFNNVLIQS
jgi:hypothetical protein